MLGPTVNPRFEGSVHGVVVHAKKENFITIHLNFEKLALMRLQFLIH